jgi:hypothetical protein
MTYKALTLTQPWATLVMLGEKRIETRPVRFKHRGTLFIHASRQIDGDAYHDPVFRAALDRHGVEELSLGKVLGSVEVIDSCNFTEDVFPTCMPAHWWNACAGDDEQRLGDFRAGRGGLLLANPRQLATPIAARGMNGLWNWSPSEPLWFLKSLEGVRR